ncbi:2'-5'-oligoadenylate synthase 1A-like [Mercenaria mercenaria]|uniref:2'-5'-oligoadenylate synthase 1A-like n=1 Tax=Mercenaria mercenaria TaxID=6596 RepID=UPI001E1DE97C|nr:2'-5'-oligoadenylate synthase 1A-like [Mercenaria mercenaria]XP_045203200.1 2'-5'-oligoadenylate synthase 1A-like [Mercenaria mercenaria]
MDANVHAEMLRSRHFQCTDCLRSFTAEFCLKDHQKHTEHRGINIAERCDNKSIEATYESSNDLTTAASKPDMYGLEERDLDIYIAEHIQADTLFLGCCGEVINNLVKDLQDKEKSPKHLRPRRIVKSGSLGKGTAVKGISDIDLVLMLVNYKNVEDLMKVMPSLLKDLKNYLINNAKSRHQRTTRYSVQVELECRTGHKHYVDILPAVDLLGLGN